MGKVYIDHDELSCRETATDFMIREPKATWHVICSRVLKPVIAHPRAKPRKMCYTRFLQKPDKKKRIAEYFVSQIPGERKPFVSSW